MIAIEVCARTPLSPFRCVRVVCVATGTCGKSKYGPKGLSAVGPQLPLTFPCEVSGEFRWRMPFHDDPCPKKTADGQANVPEPADRHLHPVLVQPPSSSEL
jgi:hypothetical protein